MNDEFENWLKDIDDTEDFIEKALKLKETYKKGLSKRDKDAFDDIFEYFRNKYELGNEFDLKGLYIYMTKVKGWPDFDYQVYARLLTLVGLCGFEWE